MRNLKAGIQTLRENGSRQTVICAVGKIANLINSLELGDADNWTKDFFLHNLHVFLYIGKNGRFDEVALVAPSVSSKIQSGAFFLSRLDIAHDTLILDFG